MSRKFFGTDGVRGTVGKTPITPDFVLRLGHAVGHVLRQSERNDARPTVLIGKDTRRSGYLLESALESGFISAGVDVVLLGPIPTPGVAYLTRAQRASLGAVISASHNPHADNGIKFFSAQGAKLPDAWEQQVEALLDEPPQWAGSAQLGRARRLDDAAGRYVEFCKSTFRNDLSLKGLKIVVDAAHGAAYQIAPMVLHELGADVTTIGAAPDGLNINDGVGATHPQALARAVREQGADLGIALDGDADRVQMADAQGRLYDGDQLLYVIAADRLASQSQAGGGQRPPELAGVVGTLMTNLAIEHALRERGFDFVRAKVGDRYVMEALIERGWILGGEGSGHLLVRDRHTTGDGIISALQVLQACVTQGRSLSELLAGITLYPQTLVNVRIAPGQNWQSARLQQASHAAEGALGERGRILIRASGTEPLVRVMVEAQDGALAQTLAEELAASIVP
jgi:phosphoglucosamine mutase